MHQTLTKLIQCINVWDNCDRPPVGIKYIGLMLLVHHHTRVLLLMHSDWRVASDVITATACITQWIDSWVQIHYYIIHYIRYLGIIKHTTCCGRIVVLVLVVFKLFSTFSCLKPPMRATCVWMAPPGRTVSGYRFSAFWLRSSVVSVLISLISDTSPTRGPYIKLIFGTGRWNRGLLRPLHASTWYCSTSRTGAPPLPVESNYYHCKIS